jgi:hypothetical protein
MENVHIFEILKYIEIQILKYVTTTMASLTFDVDNNAIVKTKLKNGRNITNTTKNII